MFNLDFVSKTDSLIAKGKLGWVKYLLRILLEKVSPGLRFFLMKFMLIIGKLC